MTRPALLLGAHCIDNGGIPMSARRAGRGGMRALQIFSAIPKFYNDKVSVKPDRIARFREALKEADIDPPHVIVHAGYVLNCATPDDTKWERASVALAKELERSTSLGVGGVCFHPGAATDGDRDAALARVSEAMRRALLAVPNGTTRLLIENTAGAGTTVGRTPEEVGTMLAALPAQLRARAGYGLDTCHLYASGYDLAASRAKLERAPYMYRGVVVRAPRGQRVTHTPRGASGFQRVRRRFSVGPMRFPEGAPCIPRGRADDSSRGKHPIPYCALCRAL